jgi:hypothetical protein
MSRSSAKSREWIGGQFGPRRMPIRWLLARASLRAMESSLMARINK